ncbi:MAG: TRAP transporter permease [Oscillospiraceae bacterium]|nr:TRAP transporter permease [Oscillospiraceae bacterium]
MSDVENRVNTSGQVDVGTAADVDAIMKKYDRESNTRVWTGIPAMILRILMAGFALFLIWMNLFATFDERFRRPLFLGIVIIAVFLFYPMKKGGAQKANYIPWYDIVLAAAGSFSFFFYCINLDAIVNLGSRINKGFVVGGVPLLIVFGIVGILVLVECCRRVVGLPIIFVSGAFVLYAFIGAEKPLKEIIFNLFYTTDGVIGTPIGVCSTYIVLFVIFGAFLEATGIAAFFIDCANALAGAATGGPAKVAVISSALCGMVSGSSVGNTVTTGSVTIPLMKKTGYPGEFAGAVEAAASTGGQIMPPIMGAAAFLMAEMTDNSYQYILVRAILPAALYFTGIFLMVHFKAKKMGLKGLPKDELPKVKEILPKIYLILPLVVLVYMIIDGKTMAAAAVYSIFYTITVCLINRESTMWKKLVLTIPLLPMLVLTFFEGPAMDFLNANSPIFEGVRFNFNGMEVKFSTVMMIVYMILTVVTLFISKDNHHQLGTFVDALEGGAKSCLSVAVACGIAGIIAGVVTMTGLGQVLISAIVSVAGDKLIIALILTMLCCIVLGMGVPTTANYVIMATTCAPILVTGMKMELIAAHMFVFYFGIVADITPPVALAAYAGSAIAKAPPMKTAFNATRLAIAAFIVPYIFAFNNAMLFINTSPIEVVQVIITSFVGMFLISSGLMGYMIRDLNAVLRVICVAGGLALIIPGTVTDLIGIGILVVMLAIQWWQNKKIVTAA